MDRAEKHELVASLNQTLGGSEVVLVALYGGMTVAEISDLRRKMRAAGGTVKVTKNRLAKLAIAGTPYHGLDKLLKGQTALTYANDAVAVSKVAVDFARTNPKLVLVGGGVGEQLLDAEGVKALSQLPPLNEIRAKLIGLLNAPATQIAGVLQAPAGQLARVVAAHADAAGDTPGAAAGDAAALVSEDTPGAADA